MAEQVLSALENQYSTWLKGFTKKVLAYYGGYSNPSAEKGAFQIFYPDKTLLLSIGFSRVKNCFVYILRRDGQEVKNTLSSMSDLLGLFPEVFGGK